MQATLFGNDKPVGKIDEEARGSTVLPPDTYTLTVIGFEDGSAQRKGAALGVLDKWITAKFQVRDGSYHGAQITNRVYLSHGNPVTIRIAEEFMARLIIAALGRRDIAITTDALAQMIGKTVCAKLGVAPGKAKPDGSGNYPDSQRWSGFSPAPATGPAAPAVPAPSGIALAAGPVATGISGGAPWAN